MKYAKNEKFVEFKQFMKNGSFTMIVRRPNKTCNSSSISKWIKYEANKFQELNMTFFSVKLTIEKMHDVIFFTEYNVN